MKLKKFIMIFNLIIAMLLINSYAVYGFEKTFYCTASNAWDWVEHEQGDTRGTLFCSEPGKKLGVANAKGLKSTKIVYNFTDTNTDIEPSTGYAYYVAKYIGFNNSDIQGVIWESRRWGNTSNVLEIKKDDASYGKGRIYQRATQYGNAYYGVFNVVKNNSIFKTTTNEKDLKVLVDRINGTYTVGPYKIELNVNKNSYTTKGAENLYNEIVGTGNSGYSTETAFAKFNINTDVTGINGTELKFVNESGNKITFPDFRPGREKEFYIQFKPNNSGAITETGKPIIKIHYLKSFNGILRKGKGSQISFGSWSKIETTPGTPGEPGTPGSPGSTYTVQVEGREPQSYDLNFKADGKYLGGDITKVELENYQLYKATLTTYSANPSSGAGSTDVSAKTDFKYIGASATAVITYKFDLVCTEYDGFGGSSQHYRTYTTKRRVPVTVRSTRKLGGNV